MARWKRAFKRGRVGAHARKRSVASEPPGITVIGSLNNFSEALPAPSSLLLSSTAPAPAKNGAVGRCAGGDRAGETGSIEGRWRGRGGP